MSGFCRCKPETGYCEHHEVGRMKKRSLTLADLEAGRGTDAEREQFRKLLVEVGAKTKEALKQAGTQIFDSLTPLREDSQKADALIEVMEGMADESLPDVEARLSSILESHGGDLTPRQIIFLVFSARKLSDEVFKRYASEGGTKAVTARHNAKGGYREKKKKAVAMYCNGSYGENKDKAAERIADEVGLAYATVRGYLKGKAFKINS